MAEALWLGEYLRSAMHGGATENVTWLQVPKEFGTADRTI